MTNTTRITALEADVAKLQWQVAQLIAASDKAKAKAEPLFVNVDKQLAEATAGRTIPLHIADQAVSAVEAKLTKAIEENARLKAEVERLTKAGDAMVLWIRNCPDSRLFDDETVVEAWNAAKGVQS